MASKDLFAADMFLADMFASGTWRGPGITRPVVTIEGQCLTSTAGQFNTDNTRKLIITLEPGDRAVTYVFGRD